MLRYVEGQSVGDYIPAAFFLHFGDDYRSGSSAVRRHQEFFAFTDMDFVKIQFELPFPTVVITESSGFEAVPCLPLDYYAPQLEVVKGLVDTMKPEALVLLTLYSPFMILGQMVGQQTVTDGLARDPESVFKGIETVTESLLTFVRECNAIGLDGFYHSSQGAECHRLHSREDFVKWVKPSDHLLMNEIEDSFDFNILHICDYHQEYGGYDDLTPFLDYPGHVINVSTEIGGRSLSPATLSKQFGRPYLGGMNRLGALASGSEDEVRIAARQVLSDAPPRFILGADCTVPASTPWQNLRAAVEEAHRGKSR